MNVIVFTTVALFAIGVVFSLLFWRLFTAGRRAELSAECLHSFSVDVYRPMERLIGESDYQFLSSQPGFQPAIAKKLRAERRKICLVYLKQLSGDFHMLLRIARLMMVESPHDQVNLADAVSRIRRQFYWNYFLVRANLAFPALVDASSGVRNLVRSVEQFRESVAAVTVS